MRAYISKLDESGKTRLGTIDNSISKEYKTLKGLLKGVRAGLKFGERALIEVYLDWDNRYGTPDATFIKRGD